MAVVPALRSGYSRRRPRSSPSGSPARRASLHSMWSRLARAASGNGRTSAAVRVRSSQGPLICQEMTASFGMNMVPVRVRAL